MKIWVTKYCLTMGITVHEVEEPEDDAVVIAKTKTAYQTFLHGEGKDWHKGQEAAILRANEIKIKRLKSLDRQIKKISDIDFDNI